MNDKNKYSFELDSMDSFEYNPGSFHKIKASCVNPSLRHVQIENIMVILNRVS